MVLTASESGEEASWNSGVWISTCGEEGSRIRGEEEPEFDASPERAARYEERAARRRRRKYARHLRRARFGGVNRTLVQWTGPRRATDACGEQYIRSGVPTHLRQGARRAKARTQISTRT